VFGYSFIELMDTLLMQGDKNGNVQEVFGRYRRKYSDCRMLKHGAFLSVDHQL
jgi:hypothetical protein